MYLFIPEMSTNCNLNENDSNFVRHTTVSIYLAKRTPWSTTPGHDAAHVMWECVTGET